MPTSSRCPSAVLKAAVAAGLSLLVGVALPSARGEEPSVKPDQQQPDGKAAAERRDPGGAQARRAGRP